MTDTRNPTGTLARNWIDGGWADGDDRRTSIDPATGRVIGRYVHAGRGDVERAVAAAVRAFAQEPWKDDRRLRARVLNRMADRFEERREETIALLALDNGKVAGEAAFEVDMVPAKLRFAAALALADFGRALEVEPGRMSMVLRQAVGVAGVISPWNSPVVLTIRSLAPALSAGCTTVVKLPEETGMINGLFTELVCGTEGLAPGVVNILTSDREAASLLIESPDVPAISFTGSTRTGKAISATGAENLKRFGLELGGKNPMVVFEGANLDVVVPTLTKAVTTFAGQFCMTGSRILVQRSIADELRRRMAESFAAVAVGPASDLASDMGPLIDKRNVERVDGVVEAAIDAGAVAIVRGGPISDGALASGAFYQPTLLEVEDVRAAVVQEEVFGPVATFELFDTEREAIDRANDNPYGLSASVWSRDVDQPLRVAKALDAGTIWINDWAVVWDEFEEGGLKQSGQGRLNGLAALDDFVEYKHIALRPGVVD